MPSSLIPGLCLVPVLILSACGGGGGSANAPTVATSQTTPLSELRLKRFQAGCADWIPEVADALTEEFLQGFACLADAPCPVFVDVGLAEPGAPVPVASPAEDALDIPDRVSETNVQESGVDEADILKIDDAGRIYVLSRAGLSIVSAFPPEALGAQEPVTLDLAAGQAGFEASELFLDEDSGRVVVLGSRFADGVAYAVTVFVDISSPQAPMETGDGVSTGKPILNLHDNEGHVRPLEAIEGDVIRHALKHYDGQMSEIARRLKIGRSTLYRKIGELEEEDAAD